MTKIRVSVYRWVPPFAQGLVRDLRVRWALEEAGLPYEERLLRFGEQSSDSYRALQPFGQVPAYEEDSLVLFESGAIVYHIAERSERLMSADPVARAHTLTWMFAALNTVEPPIQFLNQIDLMGNDARAAPSVRTAVLERVGKRLAALRDRLTRCEYLVDGHFSAADLLMTTVLRNLRSTNLLSELPVLDAYRLRCEARPAFQKALADQMRRFAENAPPSEAQ
ncbi:MAG TPA: glutathione S-transferase family protein [Burkholderiaceae bacterium]|nr:glutathione S-transferase family protein [Burkholderiaceae bacterium]